MVGPGRSAAELVFIFVAVSTLFVLTVHHLSMGDILPGNDPAVHLAFAKNIIKNRGTTYSEIPWYPPVFHTFLAILLLFVGTVDVLVAGLILKLVIAAINVLILLSTYLLCKKLLGRGVAVASAVFTILSVPLFEMISWGGYTNFLGIAYIIFVSYIITKDLAVSIKTSLLFLATFVLVLTHQLSTFVFVLVFVPAYLIIATKSKRRFLAFLAVILGGSLAILAWYAKIIFRYSSIILHHLFFEIEEYAYNIYIVKLDSLIKVFGATLFLAIVGIPLTLVMLKRRKTLRASSLLVLWAAVPFFLSQSYLFGLYVPYERFIYFLATPMAIFAGVVACSISKLPVFIASKLSLTTERKRRLSSLIQVSALAMLAVLFSFQSSLFLQRLQVLPQYYKVSGIAGYNLGNWMKRFSASDEAVVVAEKPGAWLHTISDKKTIEETIPLYGRNEIAETVLYLFYEMENTRILSREYAAGDSISGHVMYISVQNIWVQVLSIPDSDIYVNFRDIDGKLKVISLSETSKNIYWNHVTNNESQLVSEYSHNLFTLEKVVTFYSESSTLNFELRFTSFLDLADIELKVFSLMEPSLDFREAFIPGVLEWQNPWEKPSRVDPTGNWSVVECPPNVLGGNIAATLDQENGLLAIFEFADVPEWLNVGALRNRFIDALRIGYELGNVTKDMTLEISFSILLHLLESIDVKQWTQTTLRQLLDYRTNMSIQERDFLTYIKEQHIEFVIISSQHNFSNIKSSPILDRVYGNDKFAIYRVRQ